MREGARLTQIASKAARLGGWTIQLFDRTLTWSDENCVIHDLSPGHKPTLVDHVVKPKYFQTKLAADVRGSYNCSLYRRRVSSKEGVK